MHLQVLRMSILAERLRLGSKSARRGAMVCVRWTIRGSKNVPVNRNPGVRACVCVCVCEEGKGGVTCNLCGA